MVKGVIKSKGLINPLDKIDLNLRVLTNKWDSIEKSLVVRKYALR